MDTKASAGARIRLNLQMLIDPMDDLFWEYTVFKAGEAPVLTSCLIYCGQQELQPDILYMVPEEREAEFPADRFCYVTCGQLRGEAPHIREIRQDFFVVFNQLIATFANFAAFEMQLTAAITEGGTLSDLCSIASDFLHNPVYVHDNLFSVIGSSGRVVGMLDFEYNEKTDKLYIPLWLINEFKFDDSYRSTLSLRQAGIWGNDQYPHNMRSLFVNLWDGEKYRGRLLINEIGTSLQPGQFRTAEFLASYIISLMKNQEQMRSWHYRNFEDTLAELSQGAPTDPKDLASLMNVLGWSEADRYLCIKLQSQDPTLKVISGGALSGHLNAFVREYVDFRLQHQLCIVVNLTRSDCKPGNFRQDLAPFIRDSYLFGAISNPVRGIRNLHCAFAQTDLILDFIAGSDSSTWLMSFASCAMHYICRQSEAQLPREMVVHPALLELQEYDAANGTPYYETLKVYMRCERNISAASEALIIHRTTLTYRIAKIQELVHLNLDDETLRLYLLLSFHLLG